jgi:hypothetical protein
MDDALRIGESARHLGFPGLSASAYGMMTNPANRWFSQLATP